MVMLMSRGDFMKIDVTKITQHKGSSFKFTINDPDKEFKYDFNGEHILFKAPVTVTGSALNEDDIVMITLHASARVVRECGRCLESIEVDVETDGVFNFVKELREEESDEYILYEKELIDLTEPVLSELALALDMKPLCSNDCPGLCHICGKNLKHESCDCNKENIDPRLAALSKFFDSDQGGV